ncbi:uncharacterized protein LOC143150765 [Ptiloglossa arizonensis]|uniref:uncharacterized protein LOC143150765 n=1 Tax=Ptiloglossa arizonensis TaxID=3350558 RepID=UPI003FA11116
MVMTPNTMNETDARPGHDYREDQEQKICKTVYCDRIVVPKVKCRGIFLQWKNDETYRTT